jgi:Tfp pilus assembly protein PilO
MRRWYRELSPPRRLVVEALIVAVALGLPTCFLLYAKIQRVATLKPQGADLSRKVEVGLRRVSDFTDPLEGEREVWAASRRQLLAKLPPDEDLPKLVESLTLLAGQSRVGNLLISTAPRVPLTKEAIGETPLAKAQADLGIDLGYYPIQISFQSGYRELALFLEGVQKLPPLVTVASLDVRRGVPRVGVQMVLRAYHSGSIQDGPR